MTTARAAPATLAVPTAVKVSQESSANAALLAQPTAVPVTVPVGLGSAASPITAVAAAGNATNHTDAVTSVTATVIVKLVPLCISTVPAVATSSVAVASQQHDRK